MEIRMAEEWNIPDLIRLLQQVGQVHHVIRPDIFRDGAQKYNEADLKALLADPQYSISVALEGETVLGYCFSIHRAYQGNPVLTDRRELYIDDICVDEACRGQGVATKLYEDTLRRAKDAGYDFVTLNVWNGNDGAMYFYEKMGMTPRNITMETKL